MRYDKTCTSPKGKKYQVEIEASGGYTVLSNLGYETEFEIRIEQNEEAKKEKFKKFVDSIKVIDKVCFICKKPFKTKNPRQRTDSRKCGQTLRHQESK